MKWNENLYTHHILLYVSYLCMVYYRVTYIMSILWRKTCVHVFVVLFTYDRNSRPTFSYAEIHSHRRYTNFACLYVTVWLEGAANWALVVYTVNSLHTRIAHISYGYYKHLTQAKYTCTCNCNLFWLFLTDMKEGIKYQLSIHLDDFEMFVVRAVLMNSEAQGTLLMNPFEVRFK